MIDNAGASPGPAPAAADAAWYALAPEEAARRLGVDPAQGLSAAEAQRRLQQYGPNALAAAKAEPVWKRFLKHYGHSHEESGPDQSTLAALQIADMAK